MCALMRRGTGEQGKNSPQSPGCRVTILINVAVMSFLQELDCVAQKIAMHTQSLPKRAVAVTAAYRQCMDIILERIDQLAYVFIVAPFCYDTQRMYEKIKHSICVILQLIKSQQKGGKLNLDDEDFMIVISETFTKLCVRLLCESNFIEIRERVAEPSAQMT